MTEPAEQDEAALWQRARGGDGAAFGVLFDRHHARVHRHALRLTASVHDAEDVTAAAFLELWRRRADVRVVSGSVLAWLLVTTANVARNSRRSRRRYEAFLSALPRPATEPDAGEQAFRADLDGGDRDVAAALRSLPAADLRLLTLVVFDDLPLADAARALGLTPAAAKSRLHRARGRLRAALAPGTDDLVEVTR